jgi:sugar porter (SP) family MFS transporter
MSSEELEKPQMDVSFQPEETSVEQVCPKLTKPWIFYPRLVQLNFLLIGGLLGQIVCGYDMSMTNGLQSLTAFETFFDHPAGGRLGTMTNGYTIGALIMTPFVTLIVDYLGRRWSIISGCGVIIIGAIIQGAAKNFGMFIGGRIILGIGGIVALTAGPPLVTECAFPTQRPVVTALLMPSWPFGALVAALVTWAPYTSSALANSSWAWRIPSLIQLFFPMIQMIIAFFGPESPRYLIDKGRDAEAIKFFTKYHAFGDSTHPVIAYEMAEIAATIEEEKQQKLSSWLKFFSSRAMIHRFCLCFAVPLFQQLSGNSLISYYLTIILRASGITNSDDQLRINLGLSAWTLICSITCCYIVGKFKRRTLFLTGYALMFFVYIIFTAISAVNAEKNFEVPALRNAVVAFIFVYNMVFQICSPIAFTYVMEICPYSLRSKGSFIYQFAGAIVGFFNGYVNPIAMAAITWKYYIVYIVWLAVQFTIVWFYFPETSGLDLEDVAEVFGDNFAVGRAAMEKHHGELNGAKLELDHDEQV